MIKEDAYDAMPEGKDRITVINNEYSEGDLKGLMKRCDFIPGRKDTCLDRRCFCGCSMHGIDC